MGIIRIETFGSFPQHEEHFRAQECGHAVAVQRAIDWLRGDMLPDAIKSDKQLRAQGHAPDDDFKEYDKRRDDGSIEAPTSLEL
jgi:hypothetical protein